MQAYQCNVLSRNGLAQRKCDAAVEIKGNDNDSREIKHHNGNYIINKSMK